MRQGLEPEAPHGWVSVKAQGGHVVHLKRRNCPKHPGEEMCKLTYFCCFWVSFSNSLPWHVGDAFIEGLDGNLVGILPGHQHLAGGAPWIIFEKCVRRGGPKNATKDDPNAKNPSDAKTSEVSLISSGHLEYSIRM